MGVFSRSLCHPAFAHLPVPMGTVTEISFFSVSAAFFTAAFLVYWKPSDQPDAEEILTVLPEVNFIQISEKN